MRRLPASITHAGRQGAYGNLIVIDHGFGLQTRYGHLSGFQVRQGDRVQRGDMIGRLGATGRATGTHLHYEVLANGRLLNPLKLLTQQKPRDRVTPPRFGRFLADCGAAGYNR